MANGTLTLFNKLSNTASVDLVIVGTFNIEDNLNDTPSNMKIRTITSSTYREEFEVNTVAYHEDTDTWWVIKSDTSTYMNTNEYEHEIELVEYLEFYGFRHLPNCAFAPNVYTLEQMLDRLFNIAKLSVNVEYATFLDKDKLMPFFSFENFTVANAIKTIARAIDAIPKMYVDISVSYEPTLYFINRVGLDTAVVNGLNTQFPTAYEKNTNSSDQFTTRSIANIQNAKSSNLVVVPQFGGLKQFVPNSIVFNNDTRGNARVITPSRIDSILYMNVLVPVRFRLDGDWVFTGYYTDKQFFIDLINASSLSTEDKALAIERLPEPEDFYKVGYNVEIDKDYEPERDNVWAKKMNLLDKFGFDTLDVTETKNRTIHWLPNTNEIVMPELFRDGVGGSISPEEEINRTYYLLGSSISGLNTGFEVLFEGLANVVLNEKVLFQIAYYPVSDIKISLDNDDDAQDEKFFNQNGKIVDALSASKLVFSHTQDSVNGTKIRNARYDDLDNVLPLGQLVRDGNDLYVITQRSLDLLLTDEHEWINAIYTLTKNRIGRSENITADGSVISYKVPDDNLVSRSQLYKDYIELSLTNNNHDTPYLPMGKALVLGDTLAGTQFDFTVLAKNDYEFDEETITRRYVQNPSVFDLHKAKLTIANWQDNNVLGFRFSRVDGELVQTPIVYTDNLGKATNFEVLFLDQQNVQEANEDYNDPTETDLLIPFGDLTDVNGTFYNSEVIIDGRFQIRIQEPDYDKDGFEIPVFEYMIQANDDYDTKGNIVVGDNLFSTFTGGLLRYHYLVSTTRFTAENALRLYNASVPASDIRRVFITRNSATQFTMSLYSQYISSIPPLTLNSVALQNKHIGIFVTDGTNVKFLFGINDYTMASNNSISVYINNWKI